MKRILFILLITLIPAQHVLAEEDTKIDLDHLVKYGDVKHIVPTTKLTLDALPFTVKMPEYLPFNGSHHDFITSGINYFEQEGKLESDLRLDNKTNPNERIEMIFGNFPHEDFDLSKDQNIDQQNKGYYTEDEDRTILYFVDHQDIYYRIDYVNEDLPHEVRVNELEQVYHSLTDYNNVLIYD
ncbi:hypothetical protein [Alkalibacillus haloalkaliphilus]|uniref:hypothetical protein n=1 Tax=Alkalibacillus haloalkaliphilus TaxID=94136 RepID=UPI002935ED34|nr:hypothetical protein [Alkalibacillus haloalkaliphilus]MDV2583218.1 hypothetical protein [Alkalibacillus haloalkaliphilus]